MRKYLITTLAILFLALGFFFISSPVSIAHAVGPPGTVPLYRYYNPTNGDHFYTLSITEGEAAVASGAYAAEGIAAYLFPDLIA